MLVPFPCIILYQESVADSIISQLLMDSLGYSQQYSLICCLFRDKKISRALELMTSYLHLIPIMDRMHSLQTPWRRVVAAGSGAGAWSQACKGSGKMAAMETSQHPRPWNHCPPIPCSSSYPSWTTET